MDLKSLQGAMVWIDTNKLHLGTKIRTTTCAREARSAWYLWFYGNSVAFPHRRDTFANFENETCCFVAKNTITLNFQLPNSASLPEM
jgi:hypothetical protein